MISWDTVVDLHRMENKQGSLVQRFLFNPLAIPLTYLIANYTSLRPNQITTIGAVLFLASVLAILTGESVWGIVLYATSFLFDIVDGNIARLKGQGSLLGAYYDIVLDWIKPAGIYTVFAYVTQEIAMVVLLGIHFVAAGSWRIYLNLLCDASVPEEKRNVSVIGSGRSRGWIRALSQISAIESEFLAIYLFYPTGELLFLYLAIAIRFKDAFKNIVASAVKLSRIDRAK